MSAETAVDLVVRLRAETWGPLKKLAAKFPERSYNSWLRYAISGLARGRVKLECVRVGRDYYTSSEAMLRFLSRLPMPTADGSVEKGEHRPAPAVEAALDRAGIHAA